MKREDDDYFTLKAMAGLAGKNRRFDMEDQGDSSGRARRVCSYGRQ